MDSESWNVFSIHGKLPTHRNEKRPKQPSAERIERELDRISGTSSPRQMSIPLGQLVPLLLRASENNHTWLQDFADDTVLIDADLHEVLIAFQDLPHRRAA